MFERNEFIPVVTYAIIVITVIVSIIAFSNRKVHNDLIMYGPDVQKGQWYRFFTSGLIHSDPFHLIFNMYAFYGFGSFVESYFAHSIPGLGQLVYALLYIGALPASDLPSYQRHKDDYYYRTLGASGAVAAVIFASIVLMPMNKIYLFILPVGIPGIIFGPIYLALSSYLDKRGGTGVNHSAHLWGALFGVAFIIVAGLAAGQPILSDFIAQIRMALS